MFAYTTGDGLYWLHVFGEQEPIPIPPELGMQLMPKIEWFLLANAYRCFEYINSRFSMQITETIIDASTFNAQRRIHTINYDDMGCTIVNLNITACDGYLAGFISMRHDEISMYRISNVRYDGFTWTVGEFENKYGPCTGHYFYAAYDNVTKRLHRFCQVYKDMSIVDIDGHFNKIIDSKHWDLYSIVVHNGIISVYDMNGYDSFDMNGKQLCNVDYFQVRDIAVYGRLVVCVTNIDGLHQTNIRDMLTGDIYEIDIFDVEFVHRMQCTLIIVV